MNMNNILNSIFKQYHNELISELDKASTMLEIKRIYDSGKVLELALKKLLLRLLPNYIGITRGLVVDSNFENKSEEIDLIIFDKRYFNGFVIDDSLLNDTLSLVSIDTVMGIIQVKKTLRLSTLKESIDNINSVYSLYRKSITNRFHYDLEFAGMNYKDGKELNKIFSCIVSYENDLLFQYRNKKRVNKNYKEIVIYFDKLAKDGKFDKFNVDILYSILDGILFFPTEFHKKTNKLGRCNDIEKFGCSKKPAKPYIEENTVKINTEDNLISYSIDMKNPENSLGHFIMYLIVYVSSLTKCSPDLNKITKIVFNNIKINTPQIGRKIEDILKNNK